MRMRVSQAGRLIFAPSMGAFYASLLAASITEIVWISHPWLSTPGSFRLFYPQSRIFFAVEAYLTLGLVAETSLTLVWQRERRRHARHTDTAAARLP